MRGEPDLSDSQIRIHKYGNRRLYRTDESRYVTLGEIAEMVRGRQDFMVADARSGKDLTALVLAQVILDEEKREAEGALPVEFLKQIIHLRDARLIDFAVHHLPRLMALYLENVDLVGTSLDEAVGQGTSQSVRQQLHEVQERLAKIAGTL